MLRVRPFALLLAVPLALGAPFVLAADGSDAEEEGEVEEVVDERAEENEEDGEAAGADVGEASYNVENCEPANDEEMAEADVESKDIDECERMVK